MTLVHVEVVKNIKSVMENNLEQRIQRIEERDLEREATPEPFTIEEIHSLIASMEVNQLLSFLLNKLSRFKYVFRTEIGSYYFVLFSPLYS